MKYFLSDHNVLTSRIKPYKKFNFTLVTIVPIQKPSLSGIQQYFLEFNLHRMLPFIPFSALLHSPIIPRTLNYTHAKPFMLKGIFTEISISTQILSTNVLTYKMDWYDFSVSK